MTRIKKIQALLATAFIFSLNVQAMEEENVCQKLKHRGFVDALIEDIKSNTNLTEVKRVLSDYRTQCIENLVDKQLHNNYYSLFLAIDDAISDLEDIIFIEMNSVSPNEKKIGDALVRIGEFKWADYTGYAISVEDSLKKIESALAIMASVRNKPIPCISERLVKKADEILVLQEQDIPTYIKELLDNGDETTFLTEFEPVLEAMEKLPLESLLKVDESLAGLVTKAFSGYAKETDLAAHVMLEHKTTLLVHKAPKTSFTQLGQAVENAELTRGLIYDVLKVIFANLEKNTSNIDLSSSISLINKAYNFFVRAIDKNLYADAQKQKIIFETEIAKIINFDVTTNLINELDYIALSRLIEYSEKVHAHLDAPLAIVLGNKLIELKNTLTLKGDSTVNKAIRLTIENFNFNLERLNLSSLRPFFVVYANSDFFKQQISFSTQKKIDELWLRFNTHLRNKEHGKAAKLFLAMVKFLHSADVQHYIDRGLLLAKLQAPNALYKAMENHLNELVRLSGQSAYTASNIDALQETVKRVEFYAAHWLLGDNFGPACEKTLDAFLKVPNAFNSSLTSVDFGEIYVALSAIKSIDPIFNYTVSIDFKGAIETEALEQHKNSWIGYAKAKQTFIHWLYNDLEDLLLEELKEGSLSTAYVLETWVNHSTKLDMFNEHGIDNFSGFLKALLGKYERKINHLKQKTAV